jgi:protein-S-isoprenylcysteine O-methyltransferase Ste14
MALTELLGCASTLFPMFFSSSLENADALRPRKSNVIGGSHFSQQGWI